MGILELLLLSVGLAMDAFAVSISKGLTIKKYSLRGSLICGAWFGAFQALMPMIGWLLGSRFEKWISIGAPWIAFILLSLIGGNMLREAFSKDEEEEKEEAGHQNDFAFVHAVDRIFQFFTSCCVDEDDLVVRKVFLKSLGDDRHIILLLSCFDLFFRLLVVDLS